MKPIYLFTLSAATSLAFVGCLQQDEDEIATLDEALELEDGGMTMEDESPQFGSPNTFEQADIPAEDTLYEDPMAQDPDVVAMMGQSETAVYHAAMHWGQIPLNLSESEVRVWDGQISVNRGAIIVTRTIAFEPLTDRITGRPDAQTVTFASRTVPHRDGMRLTLIDPDPNNVEPFTLTYATQTTPTGPAALVFALPIEDILAGPVVIDVGSGDNRVVVGAIERPNTDSCEHGFIAGRWHQLAPGRGYLVGRVVSEQGVMLGYMRGLWGQRQNGDKVFFGKYINLSGEFRGLFRGEYDGGIFAGRWLHRSGDVGALGGAYREAAPGPRVAGFYLGRFAETSCDIDVGGQMPQN